MLGSLYLGIFFHFKAGTTDVDQQTTENHDTSVELIKRAYLIKIHRRMDSNTLRPELLWIDGRCYRFGESGAWSKERGTAAYQEEATYLENDCESDENPGDNTSDGDIDVQQVAVGRFRHSFYVAKPFFPFLIGTKGSTRKRLETETSTSIQIPKLGQEGNVVVTGPTKNKVIGARKRIDNLVQSSRKKIRVTHFLSIPTNSEAIQNEFEKFKQSVLADQEPLMKGVDEFIFQNPKKLHLTIGVLLLLDNLEKQEAIKALQHCKENIIEPVIQKNGPISITLKGVDYMNDDPTEVNVLYAKLCSEGDILQAVADKIVDYLSETGLLTKESEKVKLHVTLMNTKFRERNGDERPEKRREKFDATRILEAHKDTIFGEFLLDTIHISQFGGTACDGYYEMAGKISF